MYEAVQEKIRDWREDEHAKINSPTTSQKDKISAKAADDAFLRVLRLLTEEDEEQTI